MSESSPVNETLIAYVIGLILLLVLSMFIGMMIKAEAERQALILLKPAESSSDALNTGDSERCKKKWKWRSCPPVPMALSSPTYSFNQLHRYSTWKAQRHLQIND